MANHQYPSQDTEPHPEEDRPHLAADPDPFPATDVAPDAAAGVGDAVEHPDPPAGDPEGQA